MSNPGIGPGTHTSRIPRPWYGWWGRPAHLALAVLACTFAGAGQAQERYDLRLFISAAGGGDTPPQEGEGEAGLVPVDGGIGNAVKPTLRHWKEASGNGKALEGPEGLKGETFRDCDGCPELVVVPSGSFMMGSPSSEEGRKDNEGPVHRVTIGYPFAVGVKEVTRGEYGRFVSKTGHVSRDVCWTSEDGEGSERSGRSWRNPGHRQTDSHPVVCVNWKDAQAYVEWLSRKTGEGYRLLSESEWEYVARAGTSMARYWGESEAGQCRYANGADEASGDFGLGKASCNDGHARTSPVGSYEANDFGLHDVLGNVWEWTEDCWNESYDGAPEDGSAWESGDCDLRMLRGGSAGNEPRILRSADRRRANPGSRTEPGSRTDHVGFRVARPLTP